MVLVVGNHNTGKTVLSRRLRRKLVRSQEYLMSSRPHFGMAMKASRERQRSQSLSTKGAALQTLCLLHLQPRQAVHLAWHHHQPRLRLWHFQRPALVARPVPRVGNHRAGGWFLHFADESLGGDRAHPPGGDLRLPVDQHRQRLVPGAGPDAEARARARLAPRPITGELTRR